MNDTGPCSVLLDLPDDDRDAATAAFEAAGVLVASASDGALREGDNSFLFVSLERWERSRLACVSRSSLAIVLAPPDREQSASVILDSGAFDCLFKEEPGWADRAAAYFRALGALSRRYEGGFSILEKRYEDLVHSLPDIVYELDGEGRFTFLNNSIRLLGYEPSDLVGQHFSVLLHDADAETVDRDQVLKTFRGISTGPTLSPKLFNERRGFERRTENLEVRLKRKAGAAKPGQEDMIVTVISYGEVTSAGEYTPRPDGSDFVGSVGVIRDITLRRKSEDMLRKLYQAVDQLSAGVLVADRSFRIEYVNPGFFRVAGLSPPEVIGAELFSFFEFPAGKAEEMRTLVREGFDASAEVKLATGPQGPSAGAWTALHVSPVRSPSGSISHAILICDDISQRRAMEDLVRLAKEEAERANGAKNDFLASMSHELKSPVASILAAARLLEMGGGDPEKRASSIIASAQGLLDMLGDILDFVRFETGTGSLRKYSFPLPGFVARACDPFRKEAEAKGLRFDVEEVPQETLLSDPDRLGRALSAVLDNAVSFTEAGSIHVEAAIERREGNLPYLTISVSDTGIGISSEDQARIFAPFVQLASPYTKRGGTGIGLSLARNIVRALGGEIKLQSEPGRGSTFTILVPAGDPDSRARLESANRRSYRLLVVDDNEVNLEYMAAILEGSGHRVSTALNGAEALRLLEEMPPDAAILDIQMPGMSGIELGRKIRSYGGSRYEPTLPLVALTAFDPDEVARSGVDFDGVFDKPADVPKLLAFLDRAIDEREAPDPKLLAERWAGKSAEGRRALEAAEAQLPPLVEALRAAARGVAPALGDADELKAAARALGSGLGFMGDDRGEARLRRLALALAEEDRAVLACRAERIASLSLVALEAFRAALGA